jgi:tRNA threonylcarbamoyl adenosine modification protein (Sua5/YciO/YrdC/YwlC family)
MIISINPQNPQLRLVRRVVEVLKQGGVIGYPTDTIYGIGCDLFNKEAIERIYRLKKHNRNKPLSFICSDLKDISRYAHVSNYAYKTMKDSDDQTEDGWDSGSRQSRLPSPCGRIGPLHR